MWATLLTALLGVGLTVAPELFQYSETQAANLGRILGPSLTGVSIITLWEVMAGLRWVGVAIGVALLTSPLWTSVPDPSALAVHLIAGFFVVGLSLLERKPKHRYGGGWSSLWKRDETFSAIKWS